MKRLVLLLTTSVFTMPAWAQQPSGKITYNENIKLNIRLEGDMAQFAELIPKEQNNTKELYYTPEASIYQNAAAPKQEAETGDGTTRIVRINASGSDKTYRDLKENKVVAQRDFMSRKFLVSSGNNKYDWKMTGQQKMILNYPCQQATAKRDTTVITAWFTPAIALSIGPGDFCGLPGMILEVQVDSNYSVTATNITPGEVDKKILVKPTEGKKVSKEQYDAIVAEKTKELRNEEGSQGNGNIILNVRTTH